LKYYLCISPISHYVTLYAGHVQDIVVIRHWCRWQDYIRRIPTGIITILSKVNYQNLYL